ncbi:MAG: CRTAC1 family protein [Phycisphaeraceae bacterium]|nr:CRTAC1 family protein [Phycisphaeraceae bacterium]
MTTRLIVFAFAALSMTVADVSAQTLVFTDISASTGLTSMPHAKTINGPDKEFQGAGGVAGDFDRDGDQDIFMIGGSAGVDQLWWNDGSGVFTEGGAAAGVARTHRGTGASAGDYDDDGDLDIYVSSLGFGTQDTPGHNVLYRNNGDGTFTDVTATAGVAYASPTIGDTFGSAFGDYDLDGDLDLAVAGWNGGNQLYRNNGDGTFTNVTTTAIDVDMTTVRGFAPRFTDMNGDRYPEILWVADFTTSKYLVNNGDGTFTNMTAPSGTGLDSNGMGNTQGDFDNDGVIDWYVTSKIAADGSHGVGSSGNMLYMCAGNDVFSEESTPRGCNFGMWGWGVTAVDFNHDGWLDLVHTNGFDGPTYSVDPTFLFINDGTAHFTEEAVASGINDTSNGRGLLHIDLENDGDMDIVIFNNAQPVKVYRNDLSGPNTNWLKILFEAPTCSDLPPDGFGTRVEIVSGGMAQVRFLDGGCNYLAQSELSLHFGLGASTMVDSITVFWADGSTRTLSNIGANQTITITPCPIDTNRDCAVDTADLGQLLSAFGDVGVGLITDFNGDGVVDTADLGQLLAGFGTTCN